MHKALLLDADGVTILAPQPYSFTYAEQRGLDPATIEPFFKGPFVEALRGKADLKQLIRAHADTWKVDDVDRFLSDWFAAENVPSVALPELIAACRAKNIPVFLATNQEKYRAAYLRDVMFPGVFDDMLISCELGAIKTEPTFWTAALDAVAKKVPGITAGDILYFDDGKSYITAAKNAGIDARLYEGPEQIKESLGLS